MKFQTEKKVRDFETPAKEMKKFKEQTFENKENNFSPLSKKIQQNIKYAYQMSQMVLDQIEVFQSQLTETRDKLDEKKINFDDLFQQHDLKELEKRSDIPDLSPMKFESIQKTKERSDFFLNSQQVQGFAKKLFDFELNEFQNKILLPLFLGDNLIISNTHQTGKTLLLCLFIKQIINRKKSKVTYIVNKNFKEVKTLLKKLEIRDKVDLITMDQQIKESDVVIVDDCDIDLQAVYKLKQIKSQLILSGFFKANQLLILKQIFKLNQKQVIQSHDFDRIQSLKNQISFSYEDDYLRSICKFIKQKVEEEKGIKFNFNKSSQIKFCIVINDKEEKSQLVNYFQNHGIRSHQGFKNVQTDCVLVDCLEEVEDAKFVFICNFDYSLQTLNRIQNMNTETHIFLNLKQFKRQRLDLLLNMINGFVFQDILGGFSKNRQQKFAIDSHEKKFNLYNYENFLSYMITYNYMSLNKIEEQKRINCFYIKSSQDMQAHIMGISDLLPLKELNERKNYVVVDQDQFKKMEPHLQQLKKQAVLNYHVFNYKVYDLETNQKNHKSMQSNFQKIIDGYNGFIQQDLDRIDLLYAEMRNLAFGYFSRSHKNDQDVKDKLVVKMKNLYQGESSVSKFEIEDWRKILPFTNNFKKQDILKDFSKIYEDNVAYINKKTFNMKIDQDDIYRTINIEIIKQIFLNQKWKFKIGSFQQKCESYDFVQIMQLINENISIFKKIQLI